MGFYRTYVLPRVVHLACSGKSNTRQRMKLVPLAHGRVLEVGIGSGLNLPFYDANRVIQVWGLDPSEEMVELAQGAAREASFEVKFLLGGSEQIPLESASCDTVLVTYTLCTVPDAVAALHEMVRVLKPKGQLLFCEHGVAPDASVRRWQNWVNPAWRQLGGGCNLNRDIPDLIQRGGFELASMETMYIPGWRPASFNYWGAAVPVGGS